MEPSSKMRDFTKFRQKISSVVPSREKAYNRAYGRLYDSESRNYSFEEIQNIIKEGDPVQQRALSKYYFRTNGIYRNAALFMANLPLYQNLVIPVYDEKGSGNKSKRIKAFRKVCSFIESLNIPVTFARISLSLITTGIYYGILRYDQKGNKAIIQDLPLAYCRTRFRDQSGLDIVEFDIKYFDSITDKSYQEEAVLAYPLPIIKAWKAYKRGALKDTWVSIYPEEGGVYFSYGDGTPLFITSIPQLYKLVEAIEREAKRDESELYKLLIQKMPIDKNGEQVFELEEISEQHASVADMLRSIDTVDVLTTVGDAKLESIQDKTASDSADRIEKYKNNAYNSQGLTSLYFNANTANGIVYSNMKDEAFMRNLCNKYEAWLTIKINQFFSTSNLTFDFEILPTTIFNREKIQKQLFQGAQYGYSKMYAGVAQGIKQSNLISLMNFENDELEMTEKMVPLQSSYTSSGKNILEEKKVSGSGVEESSDNEGGRPQKETEEKTDRTLSNEEER